MTTDNKQVARRLIDEVWNLGKSDVIEEICDASYEGSDPMLGKLNRDGLRSAVKSYRVGFPDLKLEIDALSGEGNFVTTRWTARGTHLGPVMGIPPTGKFCVVKGIDVAEFRNGKILFNYGAFDTLGLMRQLGQVPEFANPPAKRAGGVEASGRH